MSEKWLRFNQLGKAGYNRGINRAQVNKIKKDFHDYMVQPAIVSYRDGKYWIIDGQHRSQAQYEMNDCDPNTKILCDVRTGMTYEEEADLYIRLNTAPKILTFKDKLTGLVESKDSTALQFRDTVESCGYVIDGRSSTTLRALSTTWRIFNKHDGEKELKQILELAYACWPANQMGAHSSMIDGLALFLKHHGGEYNRERFIKALSPIDPREIIRKSKAFYKQMDSKAFTQPYCTYTTLINSYNAGLRNKLTPAQPEV